MDILDVNIREVDLLGLDQDPPEDGPASKRRWRNRRHMVPSRWVLMMAEEKATVVYPEWGKNVRAAGIQGIRISCDYCYGT